MSNLDTRDFTVAVAQEAGEVLMNFFGTKLTKKFKHGPDDYATEADVAAEKLILDHISKRYPQDAILAEESGKNHQDNAQYTWIIDPLDGTHNFARNRPGFGVFIARARGEIIELAVAFDPMRKALATAVLGEGAFMNSVKIKLGNDQDTNSLPISVNTKLQPELTPLGIGDSDRSAIGNTLSTIMGRRKAYISNSGFAWDFAVPALLFAEAGWVVTNLQGSAYKWDGKVERGWPGIIAAPRKLHSEIIKLLK